MQSANLTLRPLLRLALVLALSLQSLALTAQTDDGVDYRMEIGGGVGGSFALTDVNSKFYGSTGLAAGMTMRYILNPRMALKAALDYGQVKGSTSDIKDFYPADPSVAGQDRLAYKVSGAVYNLSLMYELHFLPYGYAQGYQGFRRLVPYLQAGLGLGYADEGKKVMASIPIGFGVKYKVAPRLNLGFEWRFHFTTSDNIDGLEAPKGIKSSGFRNKDHFSFTMLTLTYDISPRCPTCNKDYK